MFRFLPSSTCHWNFEGVLLNLQALLVLWYSRLHNINPASSGAWQTSSVPAVSFSYNVQALTSVAVFLPLFFNGGWSDFIILYYFIIFLSKFVIALCKNWSCALILSPATLLKVSSYLAVFWWSSWDPSGTSKQGQSDFFTCVFIREIVCCVLLCLCVWPVCSCLVLLSEIPAS